MNETRRISGLLSGGFLLAFLACSGAAAQPAATPAANGPEPQPVTLSVENMDIKEVLAMFSRTRGLNIISTSDVTGQVSIDLHEVPFDQALRAVVGLAGYDVVQRGGIYYVRKPAGDDPGSSILKDVRTYRIDYAIPDKTLPVIQQLLSPIGKVTSYPPLRALVVEDRPDVLDRIDTVVRSLDVPPRQVLIEARILEAQLSNDMNLGIDWTLFFSQKKGRIDVQGFTPPRDPGTEGLFITWGEGDFAAAVQSLEGVQSLNTLAAPRLLATDGTPAEIIIGGQLGFPVVTTVQTTVIQSIQFLDVGAQLRITPTITADGNILMQIHPELSDGVVQQGIPSKTTAEVTTNVLIRDGQTLFIGGLIRERDEKIRHGIPFLVDLPIAGALFGKTSHSIQKSELITLITPRIVTAENQGELQKDWIRGPLRPQKDH